MKNIYYLIWADSILSIKKFHHDKKDWKITIFLLNTWIHAVNLWIIFLWLKYFGILTLPSFEIDIFPGDMINGFLSFTVEFALICGIFNYFLIFYNGRYKKIIEKYPLPPNKIAFYYSLITLLLAFFSGILYGVIT
jgi:hypothetical protein